MNTSRKKTSDVVLLISGCPNFYQRISLPQEVFRIRKADLRLKSSLFKKKPKKHTELGLNPASATVVDDGTRNLSTQYS